MEEFKWSQLNSRQLGRYAEYFVKMQFTLHGIDIYTPEIDDKGIDLIARTGPSKYLEIQVKSLYKSANAYFDKATFDIKQPNLLVALVRFVEGQAPILYLLHSRLWGTDTPSSLFVGYDRKNYSEWGIQLSPKKLPLLAPYLFAEIVKSL